MALDRKKIEEILDRAVMRLEGEWLLVGGAAAAVWFLPDRVTEDIDLVAFRLGNESQLAVLTLAVEVGLPVEAINLSAAYFVSRIEGWRDEIAVLRHGARATVYRPTPTLFLLLKCARLGEEDLRDCLALLEHARRHGLAIDGERLRAALRALPSTDDERLVARRAELADALRGW